MSSRSHLAIIVTPGEVAVALSIRGAVVHGGFATIATGDEIEVALGGLLDPVRSISVGRTSVDVFVAPPWARCKPLFGEPSESPPSEVRARLQARAHAYFVGDEGAVVPSEPRLLGDGRWWAIAVDRTTLGVVVRTLTSMRIRTCRVMTTESSTVSAIDAARTAAVAPATDGVSLDPFAEERARRHRRHRLRLLTVVLAMGLGVAGVGPLIVHAWMQRGEQAALLALTDSASATHAWALAMARERRADVMRLQRLATGVPLRTPLLASLGQALPDSAVVVSLAIDSTLGTATILAPPAADVLGALSAATALRAPRLVAAVTRERMQDREVSRTTVSFQVVERADEP